jgi:myo-inositol 2-dehydrogenase / D-chiro-inositol 1-dehydrogenase
MARHGLDRREFLAGAAAAGVSIVSSSAVRGAAANGKIRIGLIGCGGRGQWIANLFAEDGRYELVAIHDYFKDRLDATGNKFNIPAARRFTGLEGYRDLLATDIDAVVIKTPPYFHPDQTVAALEAGKHVYLAKPVAVDVPGTVAIADAAKKHEAKLCCWVDFQTRMDEFYRESIRRIHDGLIGDLVCGQVYYIAGRLGKQAEPGTPGARLRNWVFDKALSGDIIVEQNVHVLDVARWVLKTNPIKAIGTGGRKARVDVGDCWDHFMVHYTYPDDVLIDFMSAQFTQGYDDLCCRIYGKLGTFDSHYGGQVHVRARTGPYKGGLTSQIYRAGAVANIKVFADAIHAGKPISNTAESCDSTLTSILGRIAAYEQRVVTWDEMMKANTRLDGRLDSLT